MPWEISVPFELISAAIHSHSQTERQKKSSIWTRTFTIIWLLLLFIVEKVNCHPLFIYTMRTIYMHRSPLPFRLIEIAGCVYFCCAIVLSCNGCECKRARGRTRTTWVRMQLKSWASSTRAKQPAKRVAAVKISARKKVKPSQIKSKLISVYMQLAERLLLLNTD